MNFIEFQEISNFFKRFLTTPTAQNGPEKIPGGRGSILNHYFYHLETHWNIKLWQTPAGSRTWDCSSPVLLNLPDRTGARTTTTPWSQKFRFEGKKSDFHEKPTAKWWFRLKNEAGVI